MINLTYAAAFAVVLLVVSAISFFIGKRSALRRRDAAWAGAMGKLQVRIDLAKQKVAQPAFPASELAHAQSAIGHCEDQLSQLRNFGCVPNWGLFMLNINGIPDYIDSLFKKAPGVA